MKARDEFSTIVAGSVTAEEFVIEDAGDVVALFGTDKSGPFPVYRLEFDSPLWTDPDADTAEAHLRWGGSSAGPVIEVGATNDPARADIVMAADPTYRSTINIEADEGAGSDARIIMGTDVTADPYTSISIQARAGSPNFADALLTLTADGSTGDAFVNITADFMNLPRNNMVPTGSIIMGIWSTGQPGFLLLDGSSIASGSTLYPELWAVAPASWKSGTTLNLPSMSDRFVRGVTGTPGGTAGANTHTITAVNLPPHSHTIAHTHDISHAHDSGHGTNAGSQAPLGVGNSWAFPGGASNRSTGGASPAGSGGASTGSSGNGPGVSTAIAHRPAYLDVRFMVKT